MNISGIRPSVGFYDEKSLRIIPEYNIEETGNNAKTTNENTTIEASITQEEIDMARKGQTFGSYEFAGQFNPNETYSMKGADSDIKSLDVEKAVSDMELDTAIQQYQYFVKGPADTSAQPLPPDNMEDFSL
ncbi:MAG: hypothetical protein K6F66_04615 [Pseudobutyrivibrio sp.]|nr:hypothetical protein [Pseudobutyrivibrio sp.]